MKLPSVFRKTCFGAAVLLLFSSGGCGKESAIPFCIQQKILLIRLDAKWNPPAQVNEYEYKGKRVFLFSANCCDQYVKLYDENCNYICAPSGGFTGGGDGKCPDFSTAAKHIRLVWKDQR